MKSWVEQTFRHWNGVIGKEPDAVHALKQVRTQVSAKCLSSAIGFDLSFADNDNKLIRINMY